MKTPKDMQICYVQMRGSDRVSMYGVSSGDEITGEDERLSHMINAEIERRHDGTVQLAFAKYGSAH